MQYDRHQLFHVLTEFGDLTGQDAELLAPILEDALVNTESSDEVVARIHRLADGLLGLAQYVAQREIAEHVLTDMLNDAPNVETQELLIEAAIRGMQAIESSPDASHVSADDLDAITQGGPTRGGFRAECYDEHTPIPAEEIPHFDEMLLRPGQTMTHSLLYVHAELAAPVVLRDIASKAIMVIPCCDSNEAQDIMRQCISMDMFHAIEVQEEAPALQPNILHLIVDIERLEGMFPDEE